MAHPGDGADPRRLGRGLPHEPAGPRRARDLSAPVPPAPATAPGPGDQLALDLPARPGLDLDDFLPSPCNRRALDAVLAWPDWPVRCLVLVGPPGSGKTHLAGIWAARAGATLLGAAEVWAPAEPLERARAAGAVVVDGADRVRDEPLLFHLYNAVLEQGGSLLVTGDGPVAGWGLTLPDLRSRLLASPLVGISAPDDELLAALLVKQLSDRGVRVSPAVVAYCVARGERSFASIRGLARDLDAASLGAKRPVTVALARAVLAEREFGERAA